MSTGIVTPYDFGGNTNNNTTDNHVAVQNALDTALGSWDGRGYKLSLDLQGQHWYLGNTGLLIDNIRQPGFVVKNGTLWGSGEDTILMNAGGTNSLILQDLQLYGDPADPPSYGYVAFRSDEISNGIAPDLKAFNVETNGGFRSAAWVNMANEVSDFVQCKFGNSILSTNNFVYVNVSEYQSLIDHLGEITGISANTTLPSANVPYSNIIHNFNNCQFKNQSKFYAVITDIELTNPAVVKVSGSSLSTSGIANGDFVWFHNLVGPSNLNYDVYEIDEVNTGNNSFILTGVDNSNGTPFVSGEVRNQTGKGILLENAHAFNFNNGYILTYGNHSIVFDLNYNAAPRDFRFHGQLEASPRNPILIEGPNTASAVWQGADINIYGYSQTHKNSIVDNQNSQFLQLRNWNLKVSTMGTVPDNKVFTNPSKLVMRNAVINMPKSAALNPITSYGADDVIHIHQDYTEGEYIFDNQRRELSGALTFTGDVSLPNGSTSSRPSSPANGHVYIDTETNETLIYRNGAWKNLESGGLSTTSFSGAGPHTISSVVDNMVITVDHDDTAIVNIPSTIPAGWNSITVHLGATGYTQLKFTGSGTFLKQLPRTNGQQYDLVSLLCLSNASGSNPTVLVTNGV